MAEATVAESTSQTQTDNKSWIIVGRPKWFGWPYPIFRSDLTQLNFLKAHLLPSQGIFCTKHYWKWNIVLQVTCSWGLCRWSVCPKEMVFCRWTLQEGGRQGRLPSLRPHAIYPVALHRRVCRLEMHRACGHFCSSLAKTVQTNTGPRAALVDVGFLQMGQLEEVSVFQTGHAPACLPCEKISLL